MYARHPEIAERWEKHTPKGKKLPEHVKESHARGLAAALEHFGLKQAAEEIRLKIPHRTFHGWDAAFKSEHERNAKRANEETADTLAKLLGQIDAPVGAAHEVAARDPLDRSTAWGSPSNLAGGDTAGRMSDMGQPTSIGTVF